MKAIFSIFNYSVINTRSTVVKHSFNEIQHRKDIKKKKIYILSTKDQGVWGENHSFFQLPKNKFDNGKKRISIFAKNKKKKND